ncbi:helicase UvrD [Bradyrhizobium japonicum]|uniref:DNA 3'-5' helicase n=1 Tax=Bradyrhizobium japonicum TaxID=375 RepID=A0A0A3XTD1_BRAJP|nr:double-strand break repair helicase AddA [Bradyrhizobium japonicum]KGT77650.1 helicase UvrD [Bradyrhizobium japonicum]MCS3891665.1 ATP-dependent helicase/nuclease subunit A [Bradyrhizobium japonicum USDA 38]MCS3944181.1 ATP-dependent helicase/nuclease subunit A [Bradyrhizobium japonicum]MCW2223113.1 ATP-dependent helicase/nuclease subunit A [Bradyrhizobium japonicum]MCW2347725.1 ATP-dependent helicase/nuclease subunit A [Bradyrhizobium japonicum]
MVKLPRPIPDEVRARQARASDPTASAFVSANAGSGKTHVLVQRVIRLLLSGVPPEKILCITFTKAAAANMAERVFTTLGHWVTLDDNALDAAIKAVGIPHPDRKLRREARKLFACALETPGGLKVQTIHALCTRLLQQFPFEANVPARFAVIDERDQTDMMERANLKVLLEAARDPETVTGRALLTAMASAADVTFKEVVREACLSRDHFMAWTDEAGNAEAAAAQMAAVLGVDASDRIEDVETEILDGPFLPRSRWDDIAFALEDGSKSDNDQAGRLREAKVFSGAAQVDAYLGVFLTDEKLPRKAVLTKKFGDHNPSVARLFENEVQRLGGLIEKRRAVTMRDRTAALLHIATAAAANYRREKQERGLLDYDDLIDKTLAMLDRVSSGWVHYKLDRGVDHVLIDEAQDTSPRQWDIVAHIISEFTAGEGAREGLNRTVFAVGDEKQSIFSFQGAEPREFDRRRYDLRRKFEAANLKFDPVSFNYSFRSGAAILHSVDQVFREEAIYRSIHAEKAYPVHNALADAGPSVIELWGLAVADDRQEIEGWRAPFDGVAATSPEVKLARRIQTEIKQLVESGTLTGHEGERRPLRYGDMLILVRRRGNAFDAVIQALKHANVPVAGADRLKLTEHIAIIDLMNLADALLLPQDDLALAVALKSPLFGLDDDDLFQLAWGRKGSLRRALAEHAATSETFATALRRLEACEARSRDETPFAFYAWLLGGDGGRARILRRLGHEANDALDEFLELALNYERKAPASLQGFMAWLRSADTEVKRDMEISRDEVRVMTVHGAKGLEASVVFMVDTTSSPADSQRVRLIHVPRGNGGEVVVWAGRKADDPKPVADARKAMIEETEDEYRRLLYVAMTRAADRLIVGGCMPGNMKTVRKLSWYDLIDTGLTGSGLDKQTIETPLGKVTRFARPEDVAALGTPAMAVDQSIALPDWLRTPLPRESVDDDPVRPSGQSAEEGRSVRSGESVQSRAVALQRGTLVHRLLQSLPDIAPERRREAALGFMARNAPDWTEADRTGLAGKVLALIAEPRFAPVFAAGSRAEVSIVGRLDRPGRPPALVSGQIDRLVVRPDEVLIVDFKTNQAAPKSAAEAPAAYVRQLALYRAVLARLYPQKPIRAVLLWTEALEYMEISAPALDAALASLHVGVSVLDPARGRS